MHVAEEARTATQWHNDEAAAGKRTKGTKPWDWDHLEDGFFGTHCKSIAGHPTLAQEDVVRTWGYSLYSTMASGAQAAKKQRAG
eukprot:3297021-Alexandrium_andersonii.AAC.1